MKTTVEDVRVGDVVRHERMATDAGGEELRDCKVMKSYQTQLISWAIEWHMVGDKTAAGLLLTRPDEPVEVVSRASGVEL